MRTKLILPLLAMLFILSSVNPKEAEKPKSIFIDYSELKKDSLNMEINRERQKAFRSYELIWEQRDSIVDLVRMKK